MRTLLFLISLILINPLTSLACEPSTTNHLPSFAAVEEGINTFLSEVHGHEGIEGFERNINMFDVITPERPIVDVRGAKEFMAQDNPYTLMGVPARLTTRRNSYFFGKRAQKAFGLDAHFNLGPEGYMGKIVLAHEIGHIYGLGEVDADIFAAAYAQHGVWDLAEYYLMTEEGYWEDSTTDNDYLPNQARLQLMAGALS
tara:strand:+ start:105 stop:701 length:597 start_codon:yes stop_codon:yes gene_type:complete